MITIADETRALVAADTLRFLPEAKLRQLAFASERFHFADGEAIVVQGETREDGFLLLTGEADVSIELPDGIRELATVGPGFVAGDHALIMGGPYKVTARARGKVEVLRIRREDLLVLIEGDRDAMTAMLNALAERKAAAEELFSLSFDQV